MVVLKVKDIASREKEGRVHTDDLEQPILTRNTPRETEMRGGDAEVKPPDYLMTTS